MVRALATSVGLQFKSKEHSRSEILSITVMTSDCITSQRSSAVAWCILRYILIFIVPVLPNNDVGIELTHRAWSYFEKMLEMAPPDWCHLQLHRAPFN